MHGEYNEYKSILKQFLTDKRYYHSLCVADEAYRLAEIYGVDADKAYLAGLLHDITKNFDKKSHFYIFEEYDVKLNGIEKNAEKLWHAISGSLYVKNVLKIDDEEIVDAIRYHTTAKANISLFSKIIYIADFTSADRDFEDIDVIRDLVDQSLDKGYKYALAYTVIDLAKRELPVHLDTVSAYNEAMSSEV